MKKKTAHFIIILSLVLIKFNSQSQVTDIDSNSYAEVKINNQTWLDRNLNVSHFRNGDTILYCQSEFDWELAERLKLPAWCYYNNDPTSAAKNGKLYNWYAINDSRGIAPIGYHIPAKPELDSLIDYLDTIPKGNSKLFKNGGAGKKLRTKSDWKIKFITDEFGTNTVHFSAYPTGQRYNGKFIDKNSVAIFWVIHTKKKKTAMAFKIYTNSDICYNYFRKGNGFAVRCIKDSP